MITLNSAYLFKKPYLKPNLSRQSFRADTVTDSFEPSAVRFDNNKEPKMKTLDDLDKSILFLEEEYADNPKQFNKELIELLEQGLLRKINKEDKFQALNTLFVKSKKIDPDGTIELCNKLSENINAFCDIDNKMTDSKAAKLIIRALTSIDKTDPRIGEIIGDKVNSALGKHLANCMNKLNLDNYTKAYLVMETSKNIDQNNPGQGADEANEQIRNCWKQLYQEASQYMSKNSTSISLPKKTSKKMEIDFLKEVEKKLDKNEAIRKNVVDPQNEVIESFL
jgi:hypothetical protein